MRAFAFLEPRMGNDPSTPPPLQESRNDHAHPTDLSSVLGVPTENLAGLSVDEVCGNKVAVTMVLHYYRLLVNQNAALRNQLNTANSYVDAFKSKKTRTTIAAFLFLTSNVGTGFGINLITSGQTSAGWMTLIPGILFAITAIVLSFFNGD